MTVVGGVGGLLLTVAMTSMARTLLFELEPSDPFILLVCACIMAAVTLGTSALPTWLAA